jgi:dipeptidyl-peptidase-4
MRIFHLKTCLVVFGLTGLIATDVLGEILPAARVFAPPALSGPAARNVQISPKGDLVGFLKARPDDQTTFDLWAIPTGPGAARRLVDGEAVEPKTAALSEEEKSRRERERSAGLHGVTTYAWSESGDKILIPAGGRLYIADPANGSVVQTPIKEASAEDPKLSPKGGYLVFVADKNLHVVDLQGGTERALTTQGAGSVSYGTAEFAAQEEMNRFSGHWTAPNDRLIAYTRVDDAGVDVVPRLEIGADGARTVQQRYPRAGRPNAKVDLFVAPLVGGAPVKVDLGADPEVYLARVDWAKDGRTLYVQRENRPQTELDLLAVDPSTGASKILIKERSTSWININDDFTPLSTGEFLWGSERTGYHHVYLYRGDGALERAVTSGPWPLSSTSGAGRRSAAIVGVDEQKGLVYVVGSHESPLERNLYAATLRRSAPLRRLTTGAGWWTAEVSKDQKVFVGSYSDPMTPPQTALYAIDGARLRWIEENRLGPGHPMYPYLDHQSAPEFGVLAAEDGQMLHYSITRPFGFDPAKRYPAIVRVYGGPGPDPMVRRIWQDPTDQLLTQAGYVVFKLDNRGTSNRGVAFEAPIHLAMGGPDLRDQLLGRRHLAALPFVDPARIGVMGWSYGGYMTLRILTEPGNGFAAGAAGAPPTDWRLYDTHYTERYMGDPRESGAAYDASAILPRLKALAAPGAPRLLLLHGLADDNVVVENTLRAVTALQTQSTPFDLMVFPGERHGVSTPAKSLLVWRTYLEFFARQLGGAPAS